MDCFTLLSHKMFQMTKVSIFVFFGSTIQMKVSCLKKVVQPWTQKEFPMQIEKNIFILSQYITSAWENGLDKIKKE